MDIWKEYQALVERQLNEWKAYAEKLKKHSSELEAQARRQFDQQLELIRAKQAEVREHFNKLKATGEEGWARREAGDEDQVCDETASFHGCPRPAG